MTRSRLFCVKRKPVITTPAADSQSLKRPHGPVHYRVPYPSEQEIVEITKEIEATTARIKALEQQLRDLGFRE